MRKTGFQVLTGCLGRYKKDIIVFKKLKMKLFLYLYVKFSSYISLFAGYMQYLELSELDPTGQNLHFREDGSACLQA
jgi:hypothetical protein